MTGSSKVLVAAIALVLGLSSPVAAQDAGGDAAGLAFAPVAGLNIDAEELFVGAEFWVPVAIEGAAGQVSFVPAIVLYPFVGGEVAGVNRDASRWSLGVDGAWEFDGDSFAPVVRAGPTLIFESSEVAGEEKRSDTSFRLNLGAGGFVGAPSRNRLYVGIGVLLGDGSSLYGQAGYRFTFGGGD